MLFIAMLDRISVIRCPPNKSSEASLSRHCSNIYIMDELEDPKYDTTIVCGDTTKPNPRRMKNLRYHDNELVESFVCYNFVIDEDENDKYTSNFLKETDCSIEYNIIEKGKLRTLLLECI
jgi:hypothetical protein